MVFSVRSDGGVPITTSLNLIFHHLLNERKKMSQREDEMRDLRNKTLEEAFRRYWDLGLPPGSFATAVLANDLIGAAALADTWNRPELAHIIQWVVTHAPRGSWGSYEIVDSWLSQDKAFDQWQKQRVADILSTP